MNNKQFIVIGKKNLKDRKRMLLPYSSSEIYTGSMKWNDK